MTGPAMPATPAAGWPAVSLIICSRNRPRLLAETVASILRGTALPAELLIVDQSDVPDPVVSTLAVDSACTIRYIITRSVGLSRANNMGIAAARHDILVFTHDDVLVAAEWLERLVAALRAAGPRAVVTGQVRLAPERPGGFQLAVQLAPAPAVYAGRIGRDVLFPLNMALPRAAAAEMGGFDVRLGPGTPFPAAEDNDFGFRLLEAGYRIVYVPEAVVYHRAWRPPRAYLPLRWSYGVGRGAFYAKHLSLRDRYMLRRMIADIRSHASRVPRKLRHEPRRASGDVALVLGIVFGATRWLLTQSRLRRGGVHDAA